MPITKADGITRHYFRRAGYPAAALPGMPGEPDFQTAYELALAAAPIAPPKGAAIEAQPKGGDGTFDDLCARYFASGGFAGLGAVTRATYRAAIDRLREAHGTKPVELLDRKGVEKILSGFSGRPGASNEARRMIRMLMGFAVAQGDRDHNPVAGIKKAKIKSDGFIAWREIDIAAFKRRHKAGSKARFALDLLLHTAQRRGDIVRLSPANLLRGQICLTQSKTGVYLEIPIADELLGSLGECPDDAPAYLLTAFGKPFTPAGFGNWFRDRCEEAGLPLGYNAHGLRKAACRRLAEAGCTAHEIMAISGHKTLAEVERYTKAASQKVMAAAAMAKLLPAAEIALPEVCNSELQTGLLTHCFQRELVRPRVMQQASNDNRLAVGYRADFPA